MLVLCWRWWEAVEQVLQLKDTGCASVLNASYQLQVTLQVLPYITKACYSEGHMLEYSTNNLEWKPRMLPRTQQMQHLHLLIDLKWKVKSTSRQKEETL